MDFFFQSEGPLDVSGRDVSFLDTWREVEKLQEAGFTKAIGLSNFNIEQIQKVLNVCKIKPTALQVHITHVALHACCYFNFTVMFVFVYIVMICVLVG